MTYKNLVPIALALATAGCGARTTPTQPTPSPAADSLEALYIARTDSAKMHFSPADVRFMQGMIAHHGQALLMARLVSTHDAGPAIRVLAGRIINAQQDEINLMQQWLRDRKQAVPEVHVDEKTLTMHVAHGGDHTHMPGMLTAEQLKQLDQARGREFDRLFLTFMIQHHKGAVTMVYDLFNAGAGQDETAFRVASDVQVDQITEIARMEQMLAALEKRDEK